MFRVFLFFILLVLSNACSDQYSKKTIKFQGSTMGTQYHIVLLVPRNLQIDTIKLQRKINNILLEINQQMSTYIPSSEISLFNQTKQTNWFSVSYDFAQVVSTAQNISKLSKGAFDITVAPLIDLWGFGAKTQLTIPTQQQIKNAQENIGYQQLNVRLSPPALRKINTDLRIDLSAIAKGFAVDKISEFFNQSNYTNYLVEIGGEIRNRGLNKKAQPWKIAIETPKKNHPTTNQSLLTSNIAIATSGDYRNYYIKNGIRYSHTINPTTGKPITHNLASVTVLHNSTMIADAIATTLMVLGDVEGKAFVNTHKFKVNMIIRRGSKFHVWKNYDKDELVH